MDAKVTSFTKGIQLVRKEIHADLALSQLATFLIIAAEEGITMKDLVKRVGSSQSAVSRNTKFLSKWFDPEEQVVKGYDLIDIRVDIHNRRQLACVLTVHGKEFLKRLTDSL